MEATATEKPERVTIARNSFRENDERFHGEQMSEQGASEESMRAYRSDNFQRWRANYIATKTKELCEEEICPERVLFELLKENAPAFTEDIVNFLGKRELIEEFLQFHFSDLVSHHRHDERWPAESHVVTVEEEQQYPLETPF